MHITLLLILGANMKPKTLPKSRFWGLCWALWLHLWWFSATCGVTLRCDCQLRAKICQHSPNLAQLGTTWLQLGPTWPQLGPNMVPTWRNLAPTCPNLVPTWPQQGPTWPNRAQLGSKLVPKLINLASTWANLVGSILAVSFPLNLAQFAPQLVITWYQLANSFA